MHNEIKTHGDVIPKVYDVIAERQYMFMTNFDFVRMVQN